MSDTRPETLQRMRKADLIVLVGEMRGHVVERGHRIEAVERLAEEAVRENVRLQLLLKGRPEREAAAVAERLFPVADADREKR